MWRFFRFEAVRYWKHHAGRALSIIITVILGCASLTCAAFLARSNAVSNYQANLNQMENYDWRVDDVTPQQEQVLLQSAVSKYQLWGMICQIGTMKSGNSSPFQVAYYADTAARELYHLTPDEGEYPRKSGEAVVSSKAAEAFGAAPHPGETISAELTDLSGKKRKCNLTISGIINSDSVHRQLAEKGQGQEQPPEIFVTRGQFADVPVSKMFLAQYIEKKDAFNLQNAILKSKPGYDGMQFSDGGRSIAVSMILGGTGGYQNQQTNKEKIATGDTERDFNSAVVIPVFTALIFFVMFLSVYDGVRAAAQERVRSLAMLRCVGISSRGAVGMVLTETGLLAAAAFPAGIALGAGVYALILTVQQRVFHMHVFFAFQADDVIRATTLDPWIYPIVTGLVCVLLSVLVPALKMRKLSPLEAYREAPVRGDRKPVRAGSAVTLLNRRFGKSLTRNLPMALSMLLVMCTAVFGFLFFKAQGDSNNEAYQDQLSKLQTNGADYTAEKDFGRATLDFGNTNRHDFGISPEWEEKMEQSSGVGRMDARIDAPDSRLSYLNTAENQKYLKALAPSNFHNGIEEPIAHMFDAMMKFYGYEKNEEASNVPTVGLTENGWKGLSPYVTEGRLDGAALKSGREVLWVTLSDKAAKELGVANAKNPYCVGDSLPCSRVLVSGYDGYDFNGSPLPKGILNQQIKDKQGRDYHPLGKVTRYAPKIGAVLRFPDAAAAGRYFCGCLSGKSCFNMICDTNAFAGWGLPDRNLTNISVYRNGADSREFERVWYRALGNSTGVDSVSAAQVKEEIAATSRSSIATYLSLMVMLVVISLLSFVNAFRVRVRSQIGRIAVLRSIGMTGRQVKRMILRQNLALPLAAFPFTVVPVLVFDGVERYADHLTGILSAGRGFVMKSGKSFPWYINFPKYNLLQQPVAVTMLCVLLAFLLVTLAASLLPLRWVKKQDLIQTMRSDRF